MEEMAKHGRLGLASARAGMDRKTARKYVKEGKFPSELEQERTWRTREDPFEEQCKCSPSPVVEELDDEWSA